MGHYKNNFIKEAIIRIDFEQPVLALENSIDTDLENIILTNGFGVKEVKNAFTEEIKFEVAIDNIKRVRKDYKEWNFYGNQKAKRICITKDALFVVYNKYFGYADLVSPFLNILDVLTSIYSDAKAKRIGIRYINHISLDSPDPMDWNKYIKNDLLCIFSIPSKKQQITRAFQVLELNYEDDDVKLKFQYGMHNPDFPALIKQKIFVLDFDSYKTGSISIEEMKQLIPSFHSKISELFEKSIDTKLRGVMNE